MDRNIIWIGVIAFLVGISIFILNSYELPELNDVGLIVIVVGIGVFVIGVMKGK
jgi:hypothetical protein